MHDANAHGVCAVNTPNLTVQALMERVDRDDALAQRLGAQLAAVLRLRADPVHPDRYQTRWGSKRAAGLARVVLRLVHDLELPP